MSSAPKRPLTSSDRRPPRGRLGGLTAAGALALAACAPAPLPLYTESTPPMVLTTSAAAGVRDLRGAYRAALCRRLEAAGQSCQEVLRRLPGEPPEAAAAPVPISALAGRYRVAFVPGLLAECVRTIVTPFSDVVESLAASGVDARLLPVGGRGGTTENAEGLARQLATLPDDPRPFIVVAYSKGLLDMLQMVVSRPEAAARVAAVLSVAGASNGSPLADRFDAEYRRWIATLPLRDCHQGTGQEITDLHRDVRLEWWRRHGDAVSVPIFALVTTPRRERVSPLLRPAYLALARVEPRNDGHLLWYDQIPPRAHLLGYLDADHWTVATPFSRELPLAGALFHDVVPRAMVVEAALEVITRVLGNSAR